MRTALFLDTEDGAKIFFMALDDKFKFCFLLFLGDSICSHVCWVSNFAQD